MAKKNLELGTAARMLEQVKKLYPGFETNQDMNVKCLINMAHVLGVPAAYLLHARGEQALEKVIALIVATVRKQAYDGDSLIRQKKSLAMKGEELKS